jgi:queuine tRNA-ribosyltransferase
VLDAAPDHAPVEVISFEHDMDAFALAVANQKEFVHLRAPAPHVLARYGEFTRGVSGERGHLCWRVVTGDFATTFTTQPAPDVIFYDPFSAKVDAPLWTLAAFRALRAHVTRPAELFTYTASTAIRSALLGASFWVARGVPSGPKEETTIALVPGDPLFAAHPLLDAEWLARRARSTAKVPSDLRDASADALVVFDAAISGHPQFAAPASPLAIGSLGVRVEATPAARMPSAANAVGSDDEIAISTSTTSARRAGA